jgi:adenine-specific DNA-methyltransferase
VNRSLLQKPVPAREGVTAPVEVVDWDENDLLVENTIHVPTKIAPQSLLYPMTPKTQQAMTKRFESVLESLHPCLGAPYFASDGFILYLGDCTQLLGALADAKFSVELTVTSPPYNIGKAYEEPLDIPAFIDWCTGWMKGIHSVTASSGAFWLNLGYFEVPSKGLCVPIPYLLWDRSLFYLLQEVVWHYGAGVTTNRRFCPRNEKWLFYVNDPENYRFDLDAVRDPNVKYPNQKKNGKLRCNPLGKNPSDVWLFPKVTTGANRSSKERTGHPAQFPLAVVDRIIRACSQHADVVLDPFSGSGSTGVAAVGNDRVYLGIEIRQDYCDLSIERFRKFSDERKSLARQQTLF